MAEKLLVREPRFADGQWYSASAERLQAEISAYLREAPQVNIGRPVGLVAPHAGHFFSGHVAGAAFAQLAPDKFRTVVLLGPDHRGAAPGRVSTPQADTWRTPLGDIPVDLRLLHTIQDHFELVFLHRDQEHSLEIELPFLQVALKQFSLVPLMLGSQTQATCRRLAEAIVAAIQNRDDVLLVASSDLSHYFDDDTARKLDQDTLSFVLNMDADGLLAHVDAGRWRGEPLACGAGPIATVIYAARALGAEKATLIKYATSGDVYPAKDSVVGYAAVAFSLPD
ncbi:MAG: AmmeMemoRadiSam system protein B [Chloroflexi bacterium]|nr:MAG: AmmeMemoRadiSam system protein B [Chloroflexota bacterium]